MSKQSGEKKTLSVKPYYINRKDVIQYFKNSLKESPMKKIIPEFSYIVDLNRIGSDPVQLNMTADAQQCRALADIFGIVGINALSAHAVLKRINKERVHLYADFDAKVVQQCVITLEPFEQHIKECFSLVFSQSKECSTRLNEIDLDMEEEEIEYITDNKIDIGELVSEYLSLALDPFPHSPGAEFKPEISSEKQENAFSVLEKLKFK